MIEAMRTLWRNDPATYRGDLVSFADVALNPKPPAHAIPIVVGGGSRAAARRAARLGDGFYPGPGDLAELEQMMTMLDEECAAAGRPRSEVEVSAVYPGKFMVDPGLAVQTMASLGVDRIIVPAYEVTRPDIDTGMEPFAEAAMSLS